VPTGLSENVLEAEPRKKPNYYQSVSGYGSSSPSDQPRGDVGESGHKRFDSNQTLITSVREYKLRQFYKRANS
jgi:hypothetical protein